MAVKVIKSGENLPEKCLVKHELSNGKIFKETKKRRLVGSVSKNALCMREKRKDPEYRRKENEIRKLQQQAKKKKK